MTTQPHITATMLADLMDDNSDEGQWSGADICEALADLIQRHGGWHICPEHGLYSASNDDCPWGEQEPNCCCNLNPGECPVHEEGPT